MNKFMVFLNRKIIIPVSFRIVIPGIVILFIPPIAYIIWEIYWYEKFGLSFIKWHTHLAPYIFIGLACVFLYQSLNRKHRSKLIANTFLAMGSVIFAGFIAETFLIISGVTKTSQEESEGYYVSPYRNAPSYYLRWSPGRPHEMKSNEFSHIRNTNSLGFSDEEWRIEKKTKEKRVLALGDSFTEGMGAPTDSSYVSILRRELGDPTTS